MLTVLMIVLILALVFGGHTYNSGAYREYGYSGGALLLIVLAILIFARVINI